MALTTVTVTSDYPAGAGGVVAQGFVQFVPTARVVNAAGHTIIPMLPVQVDLVNGSISLPGVINNDNAGLEPQPWYWQVTEYINGIAAVPYTVSIPYNDTGAVDLSTLAPVTPGPAMVGYAILADDNVYAGSNTYDGPVSITDGLTIGDTAIANPSGVATEYLNATGAWTTPAGGGGGTPSDTVTAQTNFGATSTAGSATAYSRGDHAHGTPTLPTATTSAAGIVKLDGTPTDIQPLGAQAAGATGLAADAGHTHPPTGVVLTSAAAGTVQPGTSYGTSPAVGADITYAREDHQHGTPALTPTAPATTEGVGQAAAVGTATAPARADHVHPTASAGAPGASAVGDTASTGTATTPAGSDHRHARESFAVPAAATAYGLSAVTGTATTLAHSDHTHGTPGLTTTAPATTLAIGTAAALGTATLPALADHVHPVAGAATPTTSAVGDAAATGNATTYAASNHVHGRENFAAPVALATFGVSPSTGTAATVPHSDHVHGSPTLPVAGPSTEGVITLAGDLGGTAATPEVVGLQGTPIAAPSGGSTSYLNATGAWTTPAGGGGGTPSGTVVTEEGYGQASTAGSASAYSRGDHTHGSPSLTTTAPTATLAIGTSAALGSATLPALADHVHPVSAAAAPTNSAVTDSAATGNATTFAASNHVHGREGFGAVTALNAFGVASGTGSAATVSHSDHVHGSPNLPAASTSTAGIIQVDGTSTDIQPLGVQAAGAVGKASDAGHVHPTTGVCTTFNPSAARWGLKSETFPLYSGDLSATLTSGTLFLMLLPWPANQPVSKLSVYVTSVGSGLSGVNELALYSSTGALLSITGDMTTAFQSTGWQEGTLATPPTPTVDTTYYVGILTHATTTVKIWGFNMSAALGAVNGVYPTIDFASQTSHATFTPSAGTANSGAYWVGAR
jgi:hypothetical protein